MLESVDPIQVPVYILIYGVTFEDLEAKILEIMDYLERGTRYHGTGDPFLDFEIYKMATAKPVVIPTLEGSSMADYEAIYFENGKDDLCALARDGKIKQVWVWGNGRGGTMREVVDNGPVWQNTFWTNVPDCGVPVTTVGNHFKMEPQYAVEAHVHRYEFFFTQHFPYYFNKHTSVPYEIPGTPCTGSDPHDQWGWCVEDYIAGYGEVTAASASGYTGGAPDEKGIAQCGWTHYPPNITWEYRQENGDASRYAYDYTGSVLSTCRNWRLDVDPAEIAEEIDCTAWGCNIPGNNNQAEYFVWWMQSIAGHNNINYDEQGNPMPNWWAALYTEETK
ncbi:MAG: hypothetical protein P1S60_04205 [Anaerolineae bacterium]|nr:hypothetical protein [Anaerolineae bacterium]